MRQRYNGFTKFMRQLDGVEEDDNFLTPKRFGGWLCEGHECILELLRSEIDFSDYLRRVSRLNIQERQAAFELRKHVGIRFPLGYKVGLYVNDWSAYEKAVEYLREHQASQRQETVSASTHGQLSNSDTDYVDISESFFDDF